MLRRASALVFAAALGGSLAGCFSDSNETCELGTLACSCTPQSECTPGLSCIEGTCRNPDGETDSTTSTTGSSTSVTSNSTSTTTTDSGSSGSSTTTVTSGSGSTSGGPTTGSGSTTDGCVTIRFGDNTDDDIKGVTQDCFLDAVNPTLNTGVDVEIEVDGTDLNTRKNTLVRFDIAAGLPVGAMVQSATFFVATNDSSGAASNAGAQFILYQVNHPWDEAVSTWAESAAGTAWPSQGCSEIPCREANSLGAFEPSAISTQYSVGISTELIQDWFDGNLDNNGFIILSDSSNGAELHSSESSNTDWRPALEVTYCL